MGGGGGAMGEGGGTVFIGRREQAHNGRGGGIWTILWPRQLQITNAFDATLLDLNPTMAEALDFKEKILDNALPLAKADQHGANFGIANVADDWDDVGIIMISELKETTEFENVKIVCSVEAIDTDWGWYYFACKKCGKIVSRISRAAKPLFRCGVVCRANVTKIEDPEILPQQIMDLVGKSFCFGIQSSELGSEIFKVSKVWSGDVLQEIETESEPVTLIEGASSSMSSGGVFQRFLYLCSPIMKRKRGGVRGRGNENFPASSNSGRLISPAALQQQAFPVPVRSVSTVPLTSVFNRVYQTIGSTPSSTTYDALDAAHGRNLASPHTPSTAPVRLFGVDLTLNQPSCSTYQRSCLTNANLSISPNSRITKRKRKPPRSVLNDITNISPAFNIGNEDTPTDIDGDIEEDDQILKDDFLGGVSDVEVELDLDCSSQESTDSENEADIVEVHAKPHTDPYRPPPFCMKSILERCQKRSEMSTKVQTKPKEEGYITVYILNYFSDLHVTKWLIMAQYFHLSRIS
ncbi:hypothetical protein Bca52824_080179 [Brassica carinata]|uniref:Replication factor A C-terminal domain-containing protein n=1 Tax=Brassica carinata TaxID=52824 RepID=A0A8X7PZU9_BRACI|nr:hypothetical protein Bca52824_080179 [Brassica carinata]